MRERKNVVATKYGLVEGTTEGPNRLWRGIPYAAPPTGGLRYRPPQSPEPWSGVRLVDHPGHIAWQGRSIDPSAGAPASEDFDEDCLFINVSSPVTPSPDPQGYPVMVWIHGGGYTQGSGRETPVGDGEAFVSRGMVVVSFNYRLGSLGFLDLSEFLGDSERDSGAVGLLDQIFALQWVRDNIIGFGGDPNRITIYGVSAGAKSVANLLASPLSSGLAQQAISGSGGADHVATRPQAARLSRRYLRELGLTETNAHKLRAIPADDLIAAQEEIASGARAIWVWRPTLGSSALPIAPLNAIAAGSAAGVKVVAGSNGNEGVTYSLLDSSAGEQAEGVLTNLFGSDRAHIIIDAYRVARPDLNHDDIGIAILGDERYGIPTRRLAIAQSMNAPVWRYRYDGCPPGLPPQLAGGHGLDMFAIWNAHDFATQAPDDPQAQLCLAMADAVSSFIITGTPNAQPLPTWDRYEPNAETTMVLDSPPRIEFHPGAQETAAWPEETWASGTWWPIDGL